MKRSFIFLASLVYWTCSINAKAETSDATIGLEERQDKCIKWMMSDYPSGIDEIACVSQFSLPSAFLIKCSRAEKSGYKDETQRKACELFFARASKTARHGYVIN